MQFDFDNIIDIQYSNVNYARPIKYTGIKTKSIVWGHFYRRISLHFFHLSAHALLFKSLQWYRTPVRLSRSSYKDHVEICLVRFSLFFLSEHNKLDAGKTDLNESFIIYHYCANMTNYFNYLTLRDTYYIHFKAFLFAYIYIRDSYISFIIFPGNNSESCNILTYNVSYWSYRILSYSPRYRKIWFTPFSK